MAQFEIDRQTINDLQIFNEAGSGKTVYSFYDYVSTIGGGQKLTAMMSSPSCDIDVLTSRRDCIRYFYDNSVAFSLNRRDLDFIEHYLAFNIRAISTGAVDSVVRGLNYKFRHNNDYYVVTQGIKDVFKLLRTLWAFYNGLVADDCPRHLKSLIEILDAFFSIPQIQKVVLAEPEKKLSYLEIGYYDNLFRKKELSALKDVINIVYELDAYMAAAKAATVNGFCFPQYSTDQGVCVNITGLYHPCIKNAVKNDILITQQQNLTFLTGANMAGKSSFLKSLSLVVFLAHTGFPVPADEMLTSVFNGLITTINLSDNISSGYSHYYSEVKRVKETAAKILERGNMFVIFDELFRGTNVKDAYDASLATITALSKIKSSVFLVSTHIVEIAAELKAYGNISFQYFASRVDGAKLVFEYKIKEGISEDTLGFFIFKNEGILEILENASLKETAHKKSDEL